MIPEHQFIRLFVQHEAELRAYATTLMLRYADAEDVVQDACIAMWERIDSLKEPKAFLSWAYTFVRFTAFNKIRKQENSPLIFCEELVELMAAEGEREAPAVGSELRALTSCLEKLPQEQRDLVNRYYHSSKVRMADVARQLGKSTGALYKALERTRDALRACVERQMAKEEAS